ncbi:MAG: hypothetical protein OEY44_01120, partial [Candidatus Peregrinibacteria bacterium]|nr:hypothetical protein [Candidatus Peregrinibacteria bacterium]
APEIKNRILAENVKLADVPKEILITGEAGYKTQIATCCEPTVDDHIIGYITRGKGVTIHKEGCKVLLGHDKQRFIKASWGSRKKPHLEVRLEIEKKARLGLLRDIAEIFFQNGLSITDIKIGKTLVVDTVVESRETLEKLIQDLEQVPDIHAIKEVNKS